MTANPLRQRIQGEAYRLVLKQLGGVLVLALLGLMFRGWLSAYSILIGGLAYGLPNLLFVWRVFRYTGAHQVAQFMAAFMLGEVIKLGLSAIIVLMIVKYLPVSLLSVLIGFIGAIISFWIVCMWHFSKQKSQHQGVAG